MKFLIPTLFFSSLALSAAVELEPRSTSSILGAISTIATDIKTLTKSVKSFDGDTQQAITITMQSNQLSMDIQSGTSTVNDSNKLKNKGSGKVAQAILQLEPKIFGLLDILVEKKPEFDMVLGGAGSMLVLQMLQQQKGETDDFGAAIASKLSKTYAQLAPAQQKKIDRHFNKAIKAYGG